MTKLFLKDHFHSSHTVTSPSPFHLRVGLSWLPVIISLDSIISSVAFAFSSWAICHFLCHFLRLKRVIKGFEMSH